LENNSGHIRPPAGGLIFTINVEIPKHTSGRYRTDTNGGITSLVELWSGHDPKVTVTPGADTNLVGVIGVTVKT
jgi:hypothetical protein